MIKNMEFHWMYFVCVIWCIHVTHSSEQSASSRYCANMLQYQRENGEWIGIVEVPNLDSEETMKLKLMLSLSLPTQLPSQYVGSLETYRNNSETIKEIRSNQLVRYRVRFPLQDPLPNLAQISVNGQVLCIEPQETKIQSKFLTRIRLEHTLSIEEAQHAQPHPIPLSHTLQSEGEMCGRLHPDYNADLSPFIRTTATRGEFPWLVAIYLNKTSGTSFHCGGTLVSARISVTAASCFRTAERTYESNEIVLFLGRHNILDWKLETGCKESAVEKLVIHEDYMSKGVSYDADIAVVIMRDRVEFTVYIQPICLWKGSHSLNIIEKHFGAIAGWGRGGTENILTDVPMIIDMPVVSEAECLRSNDIFRNITSNRTFCAGSRDGRGPCNGDEGDGMAFQKKNVWFLRGIVAGFLVDPITNVCNLGEYFVLTDVAKFVDWIESYMN